MELAIPVDGAPNRRRAPARRVFHPGQEQKPSHYLGMLSSQPHISRANRLAAKGRCLLSQVRHPALLLDWEEEELQRFTRD